MMRVGVDGNLSHIAPMRNRQSTAINETKAVCGHIGAVMNDYVVKKDSYNTVTETLRKSSPGFLTGISNVLLPQ